MGMESKVPLNEADEAERPTGRPVDGGMRLRSPEEAIGSGSGAATESERPVILGLGSTDSGGGMWG